jgi:Raf kinase inhibitor-like YbhB/YbcL family protein
MIPLFNGHKDKTILSAKRYKGIVFDVFLWFQIVAIFLSCFAISNPALSKQLNLTISSPAFDDNGYIPVKYTCQGSDVNPPLVFKNVPPNTKSIVLIIEDPDAAGGAFTHWIMWNINPKIEGIKEHAFPKGAEQSINDFGTNGYSGPCPPYGKAHRYLFKLFAINTMLHIDRPITRQDLEEAIHSHVISSAMLTGLYKRL